MSTTTSPVAAAVAAPAATAAVTATPADHKPILAERFKTKVCRNFVQTGVCPYEQRCMFAHGDDDMRTKEMNVADGLTTEEAIKTFQRNKYAAKARAAMLSAASAAPPSPLTATNKTSVATETDPEIVPSTRQPAAPSAVPRVAAVYRHDPYAQRSGWVPIITRATPCYCTECAAAQTRAAAAKSKLLQQARGFDRPAVFVP